MSNYVFVAKDTVQKACRELGLRDWSAPYDGSVALSEAEIIQREVGGEALEIPAESFKDGLEVELEHGTRFPDANVTGNHPIATGLIVLAHLKESLDYYARLKCMELEMELDEATKDKNADRAYAKRRELAEARLELEALVNGQLKQSG